MKWRFDRQEAKETVTAYWYAITLAAAAFVGTSIDDFTLAVCLMEGENTRPNIVISAKLASEVLVVAIAVLLAAAAEQISDSSGFLTGGPLIALGLYRLVQLQINRRASGASQSAPQPGQAQGRSFWACFLVFAAGSVDNTAAYVALFAGHAAPLVATNVAVILVLTVVLCSAAYLVVACQWRIFHRTLRVDGFIPYLLIFLGIRTIVAVHL